MDKIKRNCWDCKYGSHLPSHATPKNDNEMFCRKYFGSVDKNTATDCPQFDRIKRIGF